MAFLTSVEAVLRKVGVVVFFDQVCVVDVYTRQVVRGIVFVGIWIELGIRDGRIGSLRDRIGSAQAGICAAGAGIRARRPARWIARRTPTGAAGVAGGLADLVIVRQVARIEFFLAVGRGNGL